MGAVNVTLPDHWMGPLNVRSFGNRKPDSVIQVFLLILLGASLRCPWIGQGGAAFQD